MDRLTAEKSFDWKCETCSRPKTTGLLDFEGEASFSTAFGGDATLVNRAIPAAEIPKPASVRSLAHSKSSHGSNRSAIAAQLYVDKCESLKKEEVLILREQELVRKQQEILRRQQETIDDALKAVGSEHSDRASSVRSVSKSNRTISERLTQMFIDQKPGSSHVKPQDAGKRESRHVQLDSHANPFNMQQTENLYVERQQEASNVPYSSVQWSARHQARDLPVFSGKTDEWPIFISYFEQSTRTCGYTMEENLLRLQKCLKGTARDMVKSQLTQPACVPQIIDTLRMLFGRPEQIIEQQKRHLFSHESVDERRMESIIRLAAATRDLLATINGSGLARYMYDTSLVSTLVDKLSPSLKLRWGDYIGCSQDIDLATFEEFISGIAQSACRVVPALTVFDDDGKFKKKREDKRVNVHKSTVNNASCLCCRGYCKSIEVCRKFADLTPKDKWEAVKSIGLCRQCLRKHEMKPPYKCNDAVKCTAPGCQRKHHPLMHHDVSDKKPDQPDERAAQSRALETATSSADLSTAANYSHRVRDSNDAQFRYIPVKLKCGDKVVKAVAFFDEGSNGTFIEEEIARSLNLCGPKSTLCLKFTGESHREEMNSMNVSMTISGNWEGARKHTLTDVQTVSSLNLPAQTLNYAESVEQFRHLANLPIESYEAAIPVLLVGLNNWHVGGITKSRIPGIEGGPWASKCALGWTTYANVRDTQHRSVNVCNQHRECRVLHIDQDQHLDELVRRFFSLDSLGVQPPRNDLASAEERRACDIMETTTKRVGLRFTTGLLWKHDDIHLPNSRQMALHRLNGLEARMKRDQKLCEAMHKGINEHFDRGYARELTAVEASRHTKRTWYLPIFPVSNPNKPGKFRIVFDAAAKVNGVSLNDFLLKGPDRMPGLYDILVRFRQRRVGFTGDVKQMFHQVLVNEDDQHAQRFLWKKKGDSEPTVCVLRVLTFGSTSSPCSSHFVMVKNALEWQAEFPKGTSSIQENHYVDDQLDCADTPTEAIELIEQTVQIHRKAGFELRGFKSNSQEVLNHLKLNAIDSECDINLNIDGEDQTQKVLGLWWNTNEDYFTFMLRIDDSNSAILLGVRPPTKREMLRILMTIYDPLGLLTPFLSYLKVLVQDLWRSNVTWDETVEAEHVLRWQRWTDALQQVNNVKIPRCYLGTLRDWNGVQAQLHVFVDASNECSAAVAYLRVECDDHVEVSLVGAKSKVAALRLVSVPRLELVAALCGARLSNSIFTALRVAVSKPIFWSDSQTVLSWIRSDTKNIKGQFVAFKVAEIQDTTDISAWRYIPSKMNLADDSTKWSRPLRIDMNDRWFKGPSFLYKRQSEWPEDTSIAHNTHEEMKFIALHKVEKIEQLIKFDRFTKWWRLLRTVAYIPRPLSILRAKHHGLLPITRSLSIQELELAEKRIIRMVQQEVYQEEILELELQAAKKDGLYPVVSKESRIYQLSPYLDKDKILRVRGRIDAATIIPFDTKRPIILPPEHHVTKLLIKSYHEKYFHRNHETVVNEIRQKFCIPRLRQILKKVRNSCLLCKQRNVKPSAPQMGDLPKERISPYTHPFTFVGVDCLGPFEVTVGRRIEKRWVCLFTCLTVRAIHLEILHSMDHDAFIMALRNFIARRGKPSDIFCDNGGNFVKGEKILREHILEFVNFSKIEERFSNDMIKFHFNPPESPHMGGCWERLVKSVKIAFYALLPTRKPSDPLFRSYLMEVENIVNSRPLTYLPLDSEESEALTPNHFVRGSSGGDKPIGVFSDDAGILKSNWMMSQLYANRYNKRWIQEYLPELTRRSKWFDPVEPLQEGDLVFICDPKATRGSWERGKIISVNKGANGQVRSALVQTKTSLLTRPAVKLAKLIVENSAATCKQPDLGTGKEDVGKCSDD